MKYFYKLTMLLIALTMSLSLMAQTADEPTNGNGSEGDPYQIATLNNLYWLSQNSGEWSKYYEQTANIDASETSGWDDGNGGDPEGWKPIGYSPTSNFHGSYDGGGHIISNLFINRPTTQYVGLFGYVSGAVIQNLILTNASITGYRDVGGIVGHLKSNNGVVSDCGFFGTVSGDLSTASNIGGIVGFLEDYAKISNSNSSGEVSGKIRIGGLVGFVNENSIVEQSFSNSAVSGILRVGGLIGCLNELNYYSTVLNCYSTGDVTRVSGDDTDFGQFIGRNYKGENIVEYCYSSGNVYYTGSDNPTNKGFIGYEFSGSFVNYNSNFFTNQTTGNGATAKSDEEMKTQSTFTGWDFVTPIWAIKSGATTSYPYLSANAQSPAPGEDFTWTGAVSSNWSTPGNWNGNIVPTLSNNAIIPSGLGTYPIISSGTGTNCKNLAIETGASLTIDATGQLTVSGDLENNGSLEIISTSTGTGSLLHQTSDVEATVQQYINNDNKWHFLSVPFSQTIMPEICDGNYAPTTSNFNETYNPTYDFYYLNEAVAEYNWINLKTSEGNVNTTNFGNPPRFVNGKGYLVAYSNSFTGSNTKSITANLTEGDVAIPLTSTNLDYNLVGNPYPSSIDWKAENGWTRTNIEAYEGYNMWIWNDAYGQFGAYNSEGESSGTNGVTRYIAPGQAFYVKASSEGNLAMTNDVRVHSTQPWLKAANEIVDFKLTVTGEPTPYQDEIKIEFGHSDDLGGAEKMYSMYAEAPALSTAKYGNQYSIDFREEATYPVIPVSFQAGADGSYTFTANFNQNFESIILEDLKLDLKVDMKTNPIYSFLSSTSDNPNRFLLHFSPVAINETADNNDEIQVYSHSNTITIINNHNLAGMVNIVNIMGQEVASFRLSGDNTQRETINVSGGVYIVYTEANNGNIYSEKIIVN